jgi:cyanate lyase
MTRAELTERLLDIKREKGWSWKQICSEIGGMSPVLITASLANNYPGKSTHVPVAEQLRNPPVTHCRE